MKLGLGPGNVKRYGGVFPRPGDALMSGKSIVEAA